MDNELAAKVRRFFEILDTKEESSNGSLFSPVFISSVRVMLTKELGELLKDMKRLSNYGKDNPNINS